MHRTQGPPLSPPLYVLSGNRQRRHILSSELQDVIGKRSATVASNTTTHPLPPNHPLSQYKKSDQFVSSPYLAIPRNDTWGPRYDRESFKWEHSIHDEEGEPPGVRRNISYSDYLEKKAAMAHTLVKKKDLWQFWRGTMLSRIVWPVVFLMGWAVLARVILANAGLPDGIIDSGIAQLLGGLVFVLSIIMGTSLTIGLDYFQSPVEKFRSKVLWPLGTISAKICSYVAVYESYTPIDRKLYEEGAYEKDVDPESPLGKKRRRIEERRQLAIERIQEILPPLRDVCCAIPIALFEYFAPNSSKCILHEYTWRDQMPSIHDSTFGTTSSPMLDSPFTGTFGKTKARNWQTELSDLRILCTSLESSLTELCEWTTLYHVYTDIDLIQQSIGDIVSMKDLRMPEPYLNIIFLFVYAYLVMLPLFFSLKLWWADVIIYLVIIYVILGTYKLGDELRKERGFDNNHTYVPFIHWCNIEIQKMSQNFQEATNFAARRGGTDQMYVQ